MIDYLMRYASEAAAMDALAPFAPEYEPGARAWDMSCCIPGVRCYRHLGEELVTDAETGDYMRSITEDIPGWYVIVALMARDPALETEHCVLIADREAGTILHTITTQEDLNTLRLEPVFAGSDYPFGAPVVAAD